MSAPPIITLTTDFGAQDTYVGEMKGAILAVHPESRIVDLCHCVPPQNVSAGGFALETGSAVFPDGTVHLAVVDPGVGTARRAIAVRTRRQYFVAPDNGILTRVLEHEPIEQAHVLQNPRYMRPVRSSTFEGRDLFGPAAAWIALGTPLESFGPPAGEIRRLDVARRHLESGRRTEVPLAWIDRFGNVILDLKITAVDLGRFRVRVDTPNGTVNSTADTYGNAPANEPFLLVNSGGYLEIAVAGASAAQRTGLDMGMTVQVSSVL